MNETLRKKICDLLLYAVVAEALLFGSVWTMLGISGKPYLLAYWGFVLLGTMKICLQKNTLREWILLLAMGALAVVVWRTIDDKVPILLVLAVGCSKDMDLTKVIKVDLAVRIFAAILTVGLPILGLAEMGYRFERERAQYYFGFEAPGGMGLMFLVICLEWMYLRHLRFKWYDFVGILAMWAFEFRTGNSHTMDILMIVLLGGEIVTTWIHKWKPDFEQYKLWALGCVCSFAAALIFPFIGIAIYYRDPIDLAYSPSNFMSRFLMDGWWLMERGITLFGIPYDPDVYDYLDIYFGYAVFHLGILMALVILVLMARAIWYGWKRKDEKFLMILMFVILRATVESEHLNLVYAFFPLLLGASIWENRYEQREQ